VQGNWLHDHEVISMVGIFGLGYVGIILENLFEFNKAAVGLLMATALWVIYAGTAGAQGIAVSSAVAELSHHVSEVRRSGFVALCRCIYLSGPVRLLYIHMATALWVIYAGTAGAQGIAVSSAVAELSHHVSEVRRALSPFVGVYMPIRSGCYVSNMATALWVIYAGTAGASLQSPVINWPLSPVSLSWQVSEIIFFLLGAMTIVEIVDAHQGFRVVTDFIR
jgi:hypothetical protein